MVDYSDDIAQLHAALAEITSELGTDPSGIYSTVKTRLDIIDSRLSAQGLVSGGFSANGDLSGTFVYQNVVGLRGRSISAEAPEDGYVLTWNDGYSAWEAAAPSGGGGFTAGGDLTGTSSSQTVAKINGITLSGTPSVGQVLTATSASAANWQRSSVQVIIASFVQSQQGHQT